MKFPLLELTRLATAPNQPHMVMVGHRSNKHNLRWVSSALAVDHQVGPSKPISCEGHHLGGVQNPRVTGIHHSCLAPRSGWFRCSFPSTIGHFPVISLF